MFTSTNHVGSEPRSTFLIFRPLNVCPHGNYSNKTKTWLSRSLCNPFPLDCTPRTFMPPPWLFARFKILLSLFAGPILSRFFCFCTFSSPFSLALHTAAFSALAIAWPNSLPHGNWSVPRSWARAPTWIVKTPPLGHHVDFVHQGTEPLNVPTTEPTIWISKSECLTCSASNMGVKDSSISYLNATQLVHELCQPVGYPVR